MKADSPPDGVPAAPPTDTDAMTRGAARDDALAQALARLAASREALQRQMTPQHDGSVPAHHGPLGAGRWIARLTALWRHARWRARHQPVLATVLSAIEQRWQVHPWRVPGELAVLELRTRLIPWVQRHPWASVSMAAGLGAALMAGQRWRHRRSEGTSTPRPRRLAAWLRSELRHVPVQALVAQFLLALRPQPAAASSDPAQAQAHQPASPPSA